MDLVDPTVRDRFGHDDDQNIQHRGMPFGERHYSRSKLACAKFGARMAALGLSPNSFGLFMTEAAYSPEGAAWVDALVDYLDGNRKLFDAIKRHSGIAVNAYAVDLFGVG